MSAQDTAPAYRQSIAGCLEGAIGANGLTEADLSKWMTKVASALERLKLEHDTRRLPLLNIPSETADIDEAEAALAKLSEGAETIIFFGTGGSGLGGQTLAQIGGWNLPGVTCGNPHTRPRVRFYDNLDATTLQGALSSINLTKTRFIVTSKSGGTTETLVQLITALSEVKAQGFESQIPNLFLGITEPHKPGQTNNGLRNLLDSYSIPMLAHHTGVGGRFSCLTNVGLVPALARGLDARKIRSGAQSVIDAMLRASVPAAFAPALGAATAIALAKERGVRTSVMMPYADRLGRFAEWYVQLWAESLGKGGEGTVPVPATGPLDQHSQLQLFMDGPREISVTVVRAASADQGLTVDADMATRAGASYMAGKKVGDVVSAQAHAIADALTQAGRPVRTIDLPRIDEHTTGALLMHFMLETIIAGYLLDLDPFDQPGVELAKVLTRERLAQ